MNTNRELAKTKLIEKHWAITYAKDTINIVDLDDDWKIIRSDLDVNLLYAWLIDNN